MNYNAGTFSKEKLKELNAEYGLNKQVPGVYTEQILVALSFFPELKNTKIIFLNKHAHSPLETRPAWSSVFKPSTSRTYTVTISDSSMGILSPILFKRLPFNAQVGVIGHELSHVADFSSKNSFQLFGTGAGHLSKKYVDRFEYRTDSICIAHGLGFQLLSWSTFVRNALHVKEWEGADNVNKKPKGERYMNPSTIIEHMSGDSFYRSFYFTHR